MNEVIKTTATKATKTAGSIRGYIKKMYARAHAAKAENRPVAWVMYRVHGPILRSMDITPIFTENYAGLCSAKRAENAFIEKAEADGYSNTICGYVRIGLGYCAARNELGMHPPESPDGGMADPDILLGCSSVCDPRYKWYEAVGHYYNVPYFAYDDVVLTPNLNWDEDNKEDAIKYQVDQLHRLVHFLEEHTGKKMDWVRLKENIKLYNDTHRLYYEMHQLRKAVPCPLPSQDAFNVIVPYMFMPAEQESYDFYKRLKEEVEERVRNGQGSPNEKYRLLWAGGIPPWHNLGVFDYFEQKGAVFVIETAYYRGKPLDDSLYTDCEDPLEAETRRRWDQVWEYNRKAKELGGSLALAHISDFIEDYKIDGIVFHAAKSCRVATIGQINENRTIKQMVSERSKLDIPTLFLESDIVDSRDHSESQNKMRIDAFIELLESSKNKRL